MTKEEFLALAARQFPHVKVTLVDPSPGSKRKGIAVRITKVKAPYEFNTIMGFARQVEPPLAVPRSPVY